MIKQLKFWSWVLVFCGLSWGALAVTPSHFEDKIGSALLCRDQVNAEAHLAYMRQFFGPPTMTSGGAHWWRVDDSLWGEQVTYVFVSQEGLGRDFIGATFRADPQRVQEKIFAAQGISYRVSGKDTWKSPLSSVMLKYKDPAAKTKLYCLGAQTRW